VSLSRILVSLCCTSGWLTTWIDGGSDMIFSPLHTVVPSEAKRSRGTSLRTLKRGPSASLGATNLKHGTITLDGDRRPPARPAFGGQRAAGEPGAGLQYLHQRQPLGIEAEMDAHMIGHLVEQGHRQRAPFDDRLVAGLETVGQQLR